LEDFYQKSGIDLTKIRLQAKGLIDFLRSWEIFRRKMDTLLDNPSQWAEIALKRYKMFIGLRKKYPESILIPTADILYAQLAHIFRSQNYYQDLDPTQLPFILTKTEEKLYHDTIKGTINLWKKEYSCDYIPESFNVEKWAFWCVSNNRYTRKPNYQHTPFYINVFGSNVGDVEVPGDVKVSINANDLENDLKWFPELEKGFLMVKSHYSNNEDELLVKLSQDYLRFQYILYKFPEQRDNLAPPVNIDLMWHAHMTLGNTYIEDMKRIFGETLLHHPWKDSKEIIPIAEDAPLACLWKQVFNKAL